MAAAAAVLFAGLLLLLAAAVLGLSQAMPAWLAALLVGFAAAAVGWLLLRLARTKLDPPQLIPDHSIESLRQDRDVLARNNHE